MLNSRSNRIKIKVKLIKMGCGKKKPPRQQGGFQGAENEHGLTGDFRNARQCLHSFSHALAEPTCMIFTSFSYSLTFSLSLTFSSSLSLSRSLALSQKHSLLFYRESRTCKLLCPEVFPVLENFVKHCDLQSAYNPDSSREYI